MMRKPTTRLCFWLLGAFVVSAACGTSSKQAPDTKSASMIRPEGGATNVPPPPQVDRTKCEKADKHVVTGDTNQDKKPDVWKFFVSTQQGGQTVQVMTCKLVDLNHDAKVDIITAFAEGRQEMEEIDLDFDGNFDLVAYYQGGKRVREEMDMNYDKRPEVWKYFENDRLVRLERDTNDDGRVDEWQYFEGGKLDRIGYDTTGSGRVDRWDRAPEGADDDLGGTPPPAPAAAPAPAPAPPPAAAAPAVEEPPSAKPGPEGTDKPTTGKSTKKKAKK